jgi:hypothetical protein
MEIQNRSLQLCGDHTVADPWFSRVVYVNQHCIELVEFDSMREECRVNGALYTCDSVEDIAIDTGSCKASEAFEQLTGMWPRDWDRMYRRLYWSAWMCSTCQWRTDYRTYTCWRHRH